eukprot:67348-Rhodomonas_salina.1
MGQFLQRRRGIVPARAACAGTNPRGTHMGQPAHVRVTCEPAVPTNKGHARRARNQRRKRVFPVQKAGKGFDSGPDLGPELGGEEGAEAEEERARGETGVHHVQSLPLAKSIPFLALAPYSLYRKRL